MCLLITGKSNAIRATLLNTAGLMYDIFKSNEDGIGAMYVTSKNKLRTPKVLPKTLGECIAFISQLPDDDRSLALHWRMRTHGNVDLENCHPYPVVDGRIAMMHNGVLSQGNAADKTKSDTWHYINDVVRPMLAEAPTMFRNKAWMNLVEDDIGNGNRFAIMDHTGELVVLNKHTGITHDGVWFSNTYAWSPELLIPGYKTKVSYGKGSWARNIALEYDKEDEADASFNLDADDVWSAVQMGDANLMEEFLLEMPYTVIKALTSECEFVPSHADEVLSANDEAVVKLLADGATADIFKLMYPDGILEGANDAAVARIAEAICWYGNWVGKAIEKKGDTSQAPADETDAQWEGLDVALASLETYAG